MEERLDDAINVLRNHAESVVGPQQAMLAGQGPSISHSNGLMASGYTPVLEPLVVMLLIEILIVSVDQMITMKQSGHLPVANQMAHASSSASSASYNPAGPIQLPLHEAVEAARSLVESVAAGEKPSSISSESFIIYSLFVCLFVTGSAPLSC